MLPPVNNNNNIPMAEKPEQARAPEAMTPAIAPIGSEQVKKFIEILQKYKAGKSRTEQRIIAAENWWKLRNTMEESKETEIGKEGTFTSKSGWLHNVIVSKHSDAMSAYPEPNVLAREAGDKEEAIMLSAIIPCILEQNNFEATYSEANWRKMLSGTGAYKVVWDSNKLNGLGDISVEGGVNILNLYWEPGVTDIQKSRYFFHTELWDKDVLAELYPDKLNDKLKGNSFISAKFLYDDTVSTENKVTVIDVYYHKYVDGKKTLQYCKFVEDVVLFATENDTQPILDKASGQMIPPMAITGLYDHGKYPYVFDALFPIEGSPCGYGYVDICKNPQTEIDLLKTSFIKNAMVGAMPRYFGNDSVNEEEFLDLSKPIIHVTNVREDALRKVEHNSLDGAYLNVLMQSIQELRETSGNTETSTGSATSVTTASGIAALQEASGKGSRDSTMTTYRAYSEIVNLVIELIRQFYDMPRKFRIIGEYGAEKYVSYNNARLKAQPQGNDFGNDMGLRLPVFDLKIVPQKRTAYSKQSQNELAVQLYQLGFFNAQMVDQALIAIGMMEFDGKDEIMQKISQNGTMLQKLIQYIQLAHSMAMTVAPQMLPQIEQDFMAITGERQMLGGSMGQPFEADTKAEPTHMEKARARAANASQPA
jgi:hypothetical protein